MDFFQNLEQALNADADCGCRSNLGAATNMPGMQTMDASQAMSIALRRYVELSLQAEKLRQLLVAKAKIPCKIWLAYAVAREDYLTKATEVFDQLAKKGVTVEQVVWSGGKPVMDMNDPNKVRTVQIKAPLRPPSFAVQSLCPTVPMMYGAEDLSSSVNLGFVPAALVAPLVAACTAATAGACLALVVGGVAVAGIIGYAGYKSVQQISVIVREYESAPSKTVAAFTDCTTRLVASGYSQEAAALKCSGSQSSAQTYAATRGQEGQGFSFWTWVAILGGAAVTGALILGSLKQRVGGVRAMLPAMSNLRSDLMLGRVYLRHDF